MFWLVVLDLEARGGIEPPLKVLQTFPLPLAHRVKPVGLSLKVPGSAKDIVVIDCCNFYFTVFAFRLCSETVNNGESAGWHRQVLVRQMFFPFLSARHSMCQQGAAAAW